MQIPEKKSSIKHQATKRVCLKLKQFILLNLSYASKTLKNRLASSYFALGWAAILGKKYFVTTKVIQVWCRGSALNLLLLNCRLQIRLTHAEAIFWQFPCFKFSFLGLLFSRGILTPAEINDKFDHLTCNSYTMQTSESVNVMSDLLFLDDMGLANHFAVWSLIDRFATFSLDASLGFGRLWNRVMWTVKLCLFYLIKYSRAWHNWKHVYSFWKHIKKEGISWFMFEFILMKSLKG